jgi:hypothetical protein
MSVAVRAKSGEGNSHRSRLLRPLTRLALSLRAMLADVSPQAGR